MNILHFSNGIEMTDSTETKTLNIGMAIRQKLESLKRSGVNVFPRLKQLDVTPTDPAPSTTIQTPSRKTAADTREPKESLSAPPTIPAIPKQTISEGWPEMRKSEKIEALEILSQEVAACTKCTELAETRTQTVFGVGNPNARVCFFGEAPGADEDRQGEPFVGRAGQLLTKIIEACSFKREDVYIMNVLRCRPPGNRNPSPEESSHCRPFFERQFEIVAPKYIVCLGTIAATTLLETKTSIGKLRGKFHEYRGARVVATYHPAYLLRNPPAKKYVWDDMKMLLKDMGIKIPKGPS